MEKHFDINEQGLSIRCKLICSASDKTARSFDHIAIVTHGGALDVLYRAATGLGLQDARTWRLGNAALNRLLWTPESGLTLVGWADEAHLENAPLHGDI